MTLPEAQAILTDDTCRCGAVPTAYQDYGVTWIECPKCQHSAAVPDWDLDGCLRLWAERNL